jgi:hypothetical protein
MGIRIRAATPPSTPRGLDFYLHESEELNAHMFLLDAFSFKMQKAHAKKKNAWHSYNEIYNSITHASPL